MKSGNRIAPLANVACVLSLAFAAAQTAAVVPLVAGLGKQILQNMIFGQVKTQLFGSLAQMGCKGAKVVSLFSEAKQQSLLRRSRPVGGTLMPPNPAGTTSTAVPDVLRFSGGSIGGGPLPPGTTRVGPYVMPDMPELMARAQQRDGAGGGNRPTMTPEQMQRATSTMDQARQALAQPPLSRAETLGVFGELKDAGVLTDDLYAEARDCIELAPDSAAQQLGHAGALLKTMVLPQLVAMHNRLNALSPEDQAHLADELAAALREAKPSDRNAFKEGLGAGFFPAPVLQRVRASGALD